MYEKYNLKGPKKLFWALSLSLIFSMEAHAQSINLQFEKGQARDVINSVKKQSGYDFFYKKNVLAQAQPITIHIKGGELKTVMDQIVKNQPFVYSIVGQTVVISLRQKDGNQPTTTAPSNRGGQQGIAVEGKVSSSNGPISGATIEVKGTKRGVSTDAFGAFECRNLAIGDVLIIKSLGYQTREIEVAKAQNFQYITLDNAVNALDEVQTLAYGQLTSKRLSVGSSVTITKQDIERQPVANVLQALKGLVPGLEVTQSSGLPGSDINYQIRGRSSVEGRIFASPPLVIVDGVPYPSIPVNEMSSVQGSGVLFTQPVGFGNSLFNIDPSTIESVEVLKDADATAIYGSRAGNGVILINTKKGKMGSTQVDLEVNRGISTLQRRVDMLSTADYLALRKEAFEHAGSTPDASSAPDLVSWSQALNNDWQKKLLGNTAQTTNARFSVNGGNEGTTFLVGMDFSKQTSIYPDDRGFQRGGYHVNINHFSANRKFYINMSSMGSMSKNTLPNGDFNTLALQLPPNFDAYLENGNLNWTIGRNPYGSLKSDYKAENMSLNTNLQLKYSFNDHLNVGSNFGVNYVAADNNVLSPLESMAPSAWSSGSQSYAHNYSRTVSAEPFLNYNRKLGLGKLDFFLGSTIQHTVNEQPIFLTGYGYTSDVNLKDISAASGYFVNGAYQAYRYLSAFAKVNYNWQDRYIVSGSVRRDGSSRLGPDRRWGNFGSVAGAWIFTNESFIPKNPILSFGKIRSSIGWVGADNVQAYQYMETYISTVNYEGMAGVVPSRVANPDYGWEQTKKQELGLELGFWRDRISLSASLFNNKTYNQLVSYPLAGQTGFSSYQANLNDAVIQNKGLELSVSSRNISNKNFSWKTTFNLTLPQNKLLSFDRMESTPYASYYTIGKPLDGFYALDYQGLDDEGKPKYSDLNGDGEIDENTLVDKNYVGHGYSSYYGGLQNSFSFKNFTLDFLLQYAGGGTRRTLLYEENQPGLLYNVSRPTVQLIRDLQLEQLMIQPNDTEEYYRFRYYSPYAYTKTSYIRLQNVACSYILPEAWIQRIRMKQLRVFVQAQNVALWSSYKGMDPETGPTSIAPLLTLTAGIKLTL